MVKWSILVKSGMSVNLSTKRRVVILAVIGILGLFSSVFFSGISKNLMKYPHEKRFDFTTYLITTAYKKERININFCSIFFIFLSQGMSISQYDSWREKSDKQVQIRIKLRQPFSQRSEVYDEKVYIIVDRCWFCIDPDSAFGPTTETAASSTSCHATPSLASYYAGSCSAATGSQFLLRPPSPTGCIVSRPPLSATDAPAGRATQSDRCSTSDCTTACYCTLLPRLSCSGE